MKAGPSIRHAREQRAQRQAQQRHHERREQQRAADAGDRHAGKIGLHQRLDQEHREQHVIGQPFQPVPLRLQPHQAALQDEAEHDQQEHRQQCGDHHRHCQRSPRNLGQTIQRALQDEHRGVLVDHFGALGAADVHADQFALDRRGRKPLVPQSDGQIGEGGKVAGKGAGRLRARSLAAVHVDGQAEHEAHRIAFGRERQQPRRVGLERLALDCLDAGREPAVGIGNGNADGLGAEIEADQRAALRPVRGGFDQRENEGGHGMRITCAPQRRQSRKRHGIPSNAMPLREFDLPDRDRD